MLKIVILVLCILQIVNSRGSVNFNDNQIEESTEKYCMSYPMKKNWFFAYEYCLKKGEQLVVIDSLEKHNEIVTFINNLNLNNEFNDWHKGIWTSGTDNGFEGSFYWMPNGNDIYPFSHWKIGEPNGGHGENCIALWNVAGYGFRWYDLSCNWELPFICEKILPSIDERMQF